MNKAFLAFALLSIISIPLLSACSNSSGEISPAQPIFESGSSAGFLRAKGPRGWVFPDDYGPHPEFQTEWWYYTGTLQSSDGSQYGYQLTFFRRGLAPPQEIINAVEDYRESMDSIGQWFEECCSFGPGIMKIDN